MLRIGAMNMLLHGVDDPNIEYKDSLSEMNTDKEKYSLILANPPFKGSLDYDGVSADLLKVAKTKKTELRKVEKILKKRDFRYYVFFVVGTNCGLRISDILNLNVGDVKDKTHINIKEKKTSKHKRFPINAKLIALFDNLTLNRYLDEALFL